MKCKRAQKLLAGYVNEVLKPAENRAVQEHIAECEICRKELGTLKNVLELRTEQSALLLRSLLGPIRLEPTQGDVGRPYYLARTTINTLAILEPPPRKGGGSDGGSNSLRWWRRRESNPRPKKDPCKRLRV